MTSALELRQVSKIYGSGPTEVRALCDVDLAVEPGELVAIMGPSGSGKSTLLTIAGSLEEATSGEVLVDGVDLATISRSDRARMRRRSIGYVFQDFNLLPGLTAVENVTLPLELDGIRPKAAHATGVEAMATLGVADHADRYADELSGGERQRVAIARAIVGERGLLLADEPTGALDSVNGESVMRLLRAATRRGVAGVVVTHEAQLASWADRVVFLRDGHVVDQTIAPQRRARGPRRGGIAARRPLARWAWRLFRREWRQQILVLALLTLAVAAAIASVTIAYNSSPTDDAELGSATQLLRFDGADPRRLEAGLAAARQQFGTVDVIGHRSVVVPGGIDKVEFRAQDPHGAYGAARLALRQGSYPNGPGQVAITDGVATILGLELGKTLDLDGRRRTVVGIVENPGDLSDEFALVSPASAGAPDDVTVLFDAGDASVDAFIARARERSALLGSETRESNRAADALAMFSVGTVFVLLATLVAAAGFAVIAQRRLRQLGMLAAIGATEKQLRLVLLWNGAVVGAIGALIGTVAGLGLWLAIASTLEPAVGHRIDRLSLPWPLLAMVAIVAVLGATAAAWWPGRAVARVPVTLALSARPPRPKPAHRSAIVAALLIAAGIAGLVLSDRSSKPLIVTGILATILGTLLLGPLAIRLLARPARHTPIAVRLALRDLARYQARSGAALAAITLALGIAAAVVVLSAAEERKDDALPPNLSDRQIRVYTGFNEPEILEVHTPAELERMAARVRQLAARLGDAAVIPLHNAVRQGVQPGVTNDGKRVISTEVLTRKVGDPANSRWDGRGMMCLGKPNCYVIESRLYVATPAMLAYLGIDPSTVDPSTDFLADKAVPTDELVIPDTTRREGAPASESTVANVQTIDSPDLHGSPSTGAGLAPDSFITPDGLRRRGWKQTPSGWLLQTSRPLTSQQVADAREFAADTGLTIETRRESSSTTPIAIATAAGALLALAILAMTVGLIRSESVGDLRTLTATGATSRIRRTLTAATAGALALLGALLGVAGAYLTLVATYLDDLGYLARIPLLPLVLIVLGVPLAAAAAGWLLAGREPPAIARPVIE